MTDEKREGSKSGFMHSELVLERDACFAYEEMDRPTLPTYRSNEYFFSGRVTIHMRLTLCGKEKKSVSKSRSFPKAFSQSDSKTFRLSPKV